MSKNKQNKRNFTNDPTNSGPYVRDENENFRINAIKSRKDIWSNMYSDDSSTLRRYDNTIAADNFKCCIILAFINANQIFHQFLY